MIPTLNLSRLGAISAALLLEKNNVCRCPRWLGRHPSRSSSAFTCCQKVLIVGRASLAPVSCQSSLGLRPSTVRRGQLVDKAQARG